MNDPRFWKRLTKSERREYMRLQTAPSYGGGGYNLPDDCSECGACGNPMLGSGHCSSCLRRHIELFNKGKGIK